MVADRVWRVDVKVLCIIDDCTRMGKQARKLDMHVSKEVNIDNVAVV